MKNRDDYIQEVTALRVSPQLRARIAAQESKAKNGYLRSALRLAATAACAAALLFAAGVLWSLTHQGGSRNPVLTNPPVQHTPTPSPTQDPVPEGLIASDVNAPPKVLTAAAAFVRERFDWWSTHSGSCRYLDGQEIPVGEPAEYDQWRITALDRAWENDRLMGGGTVSAYYINWGLHTTTPERAEEICAGGMYLDEGDWFIPGGNYLLFLETGDGEYQYLTAQMIGGLPEPDEELFIDDVIRDLAKVLPTPEGTVAEGLEVPQEVLDCAAELARDAFDWEFQYRVFGSEPRGTQVPYYYPSEDYVYHEGMEAVKRPLLLDDWRIVDLSPEFESADMIDGATVVLYGVAYEYHTSMPALPDIYIGDVYVDHGTHYYAEDGWYFLSRSNTEDHEGVLCLRWDSGELEVVGRYGDNDWVVGPYKENALRKRIEGYLAEKETPTPTPTPTSRPLPEGRLDEDVSASVEELTIAVKWIKDRFTAVCEEAESQAKETERQAAEFDNWRITSVEKCWESEAEVEVYRVGYAFHTSTPDRVVLTGDAYLDGDGWYFENLDYYLLCGRIYESLLYFTDCRITDCAPGEDAFARQVREAMLASSYGSEYLYSTIPGITIGVPFEELPESLRSILTPEGEPWRGSTDGTVSDPIHKVNICRRYVAPGIEVITSRIAPEKLKELLQYYDKADLMDAFGVRTRQEAYELEVDREYVHTVILTGPEYATGAGQRVGDTVDTEDPNTYLHGGIGMETSVYTTVKDGVITEIEVWDWIGRRVGRFFDP